MTVSWLEGKDVRCTWFDEKNELQQAMFVLPQLVVIDDPD
ncbi:hypothetical protein CP97_06280 [Aurantiacibacter atlanticus]|uniref:DUF2158 domain-containing protein n=2 Tax=Aurantiacibacter atlanticus TaxID=1648404 RepID=A0A0H4VBE6_9SPHN|nr:hypothetical protein CP97_06280 [Aurantiacibacter atlanticus]